MGSGYAVAALATVAPRIASKMLRFMRSGDRNDNMCQRRTTSVLCGSSSGLQGRSKMAPNKERAASASPKRCQKFSGRLQKSSEIDLTEKPSDPVITW